MNKFLCCCLMMGMALWVQPAEARKALRHSAVKAETAVPGKEITQDEDGSEPDTTGSIATEFNCELGNKVTIYENADDHDHLALRWKRSLHRLTRVGTSTGANRFENRVSGLFWIGIPAKSMLLDSKKQRQLANECRSAQQMTAR